MDSVARALLGANAPLGPVRNNNPLSNTVQPMVDQIMAQRQKGIGERLGEVFGFRNGQWQPPGLADSVSAALMAVPGVRGMSPKLYHGTTRASANAIKQGGFNVPASGENAVFLSDAPKDALEFAYSKPQASRTNTKLVPGYVDESKLFQFDANGEVYHPEMMQQILNDAKVAGAPGAKISNIQNFEQGAPSTSYAIFDPKMINILRQKSP